MSKKNLYCFRRESLSVNFIRCVSNWKFLHSFIYIYIYIYNKFISIIAKYNLLREFLAQLMHVMCKCAYEWVRLIFNGMGSKTIGSFGLYSICSIGSITWLVHIKCNNFLRFLCATNLLTNFQFDWQEGKSQNYSLYVKLQCEIINFPKFFTSMLYNHDLPSKICITSLVGHYTKYVWSW